MSLKDPIHEGQLEVLRWIGDGCPAGRWEGHRYKTIANALASRRLATISKRGGTWSAVVTPAGSHYLEHGDYPPNHWQIRKRAAAPPPAAQPAAASKPQFVPHVPPKPPKPKPSPTGITPSQQLLSDIEAAGGVLERYIKDDDTNYGMLVGVINRHQLAPNGQHVIMYKGDTWNDLIVRLVPSYEWKTESPAVVAAKERIGRWHPLVAALRSNDKFSRVGKEHHRRAAILFHCLIVEAEARGLSAKLVTHSQSSDYYSRRESRPGLVVLSLDGYSCSVGIKQYLDQTEHIPTEKEVEDSKRYSWRSWPKYDHAPSKRLALVTYGYLTGQHEKEWADTKRLTVEDRLNDLVTAIQDWAIVAADSADRKRIAEERKTRRIERENAQARAAYVEATLGTRLRADAEAWERAAQLRRYVDELRDAAGSLVDADEATAASDWITWCHNFIDETIDPLKQPIRRPVIPEPNDKDIAEFRRHLGFGRSTMW